MKKEIAYQKKGTSILPAWKNNYQLIKIFRKIIFEIFIYFY